MAQEFNGSEFESSGLIKAAVYALGGDGKTTLVTRVPESWGRGVYIAAAKNSPLLSSILPDDRKRLHVVVPDGNVKRLGDDPKYKGENPDYVVDFDWKREAYQLAQRNWERHLGYKPGFIIWDDMTQTADWVLRQNALKVYFSTKGNSPSSGPAAASADIAMKYTLPQMGDYLMAGSEILQIIEWLIDQPMHVLCLFQEGMQDAEKEKGRHLLFGPMTIGRSGPRTVPNRFDVCFYLTRDKDPAKNPSGKVRVLMAHAEDHVAKITSYDTEAMQRIDHVRWIGPKAEEAREFWSWVQSLRK